MNTCPRPSPTGSPRSSSCRCGHRAGVVKEALRRDRDRRPRPWSCRGSLGAGTGVRDQELEAVSGRPLEQSARIGRALRPLGWIADRLAHLQEEPLEPTGGIEREELAGRLTDVSIAVSPPARGMDEVAAFRSEKLAVEIELVLARPRRTPRPRGDGCAEAGRSPARHDRRLRHRRRPPPPPSPSPRSSSPRTQRRRAPSAVISIILTSFRKLC